MASISEFSATLDGTTLYGSLTITVKSRTATSVTFDYSTTLRCPSGYSSAGYETYTGYIGVSGTSITSNSATVTYKALNTAWSPGSSKTVTGTITCSTSSASSLTANVSFYFMTSIGSAKSSTKTTSLSTGAGAITPTAPTTVSGKTNVGGSTSTFYIGYNPDASIAVTVSGGSNVSSYEIQVSVSGGSWTSCSSTYTPTTKTAGTTYQFRARSKSSTGNYSSYTTGNTITVGYRASTISSLSAKTNVSSSTSTFYIGYNPDSTIVLTPSGGTNVSSYTYQMSKNGGSYSNIATAQSGAYTYTPSGLAVGDTVQFRVCVVGLNGGTSSYVTSTTLTVQYRIPEAPTFLTPTQKTVVDVDTVIHCSWEAPPQTVTSYSIRVVVNGEVKNSTVLGSTSTSWSYSRLQANETAYFEIAATNASGSSQYVKSPVYTTIAVMPVMVPCYVMVNGSWQPVSVTTLINNE